MPLTIKYRPVHHTDSPLVSYNYNHSYYIQSKCKLLITLLWRVRSISRVRI